MAEKIFNKNSLLKVLARKPAKTTPIWIMRQAGRYLPEYRKLRKKAENFMDFCKTPALAVEATLQPIERFDLDAAIIFSDILTIPDAMNLGVDFLTGIGPQIQKPVRSVSAVEKLFVPDPQLELGYVLEAITQAKRALKNQVPLIGFAGSPWTIATYMIEGGPSKNFARINQMRYAQPNLLKQILSVLTKSITLYLQAQVQAGVDVIMLFDTWGGILSKQAYLEFSLSFMQEIIAPLKKVVPTIVFTKNGGRHLTEIAQTGTRAIGLDWLADLPGAYELLGPSAVLQGNLEPSVLYGKPESIRQAVKASLAALPRGAHHIFNLGHGILPDIQPEQVAVLIEAVRDFSQLKES